MSFEAMTWAKDQKCGSAPAKLVLMMLANHANGHTGQCNPRQKLLAKECEMCVNTLRGHINTLAELGLLEIQTRFAEGVQLSNQYVLNLGGVPQKLRGGTSEVAGGAPKNWYPVEQGKETGIEINPLPPTHGGKTLDRSAGEQVEVASEPQVESKPQIPVNEAELIYQQYPKKVGKGAALKAITKALKTTSFEVLMESTKAFAEATSRWAKGDHIYIKDPSTWYNQQCWDDDRSQWESRAKRPASGSLQKQPELPQELPSFNPFLEALK